MKLDRRSSVLALLVTLFVMGCGSGATKQVASPPQSPSVSTTRLMSAELKSADDAPKVGKSQHVSSPGAAEEAPEKERAPRRRDGRPGGGFSGYK